MVYYTQITPQHDEVFKNLKFIFEISVSPVHTEIYDMLQGIHMWVSAYYSENIKLFLTLT